MSIKIGEPRGVESFDLVRSGSPRVVNSEYEDLWQAFVNLRVGEGSRVSLPAAYDLRRYVKLARSAINNRCRDEKLPVRPSLRLINGDANSFLLGKIAAKQK